MTIAQIIAALLPIFAQAAPKLIADIAALIHGNPQNAGETDADYIARIDAAISSTAGEIAAEDAEIQK